MTSDEKETPAAQAARRLTLIAEAEGLIVQHPDSFLEDEEKRLRLVLAEARTAIGLINLRSVASRLEQGEAVPFRVHELLREAKAKEWLARAFIDSRVAE